MWVDRFIDQFEFVKGAVTSADAQVYGSFLRDPAHLEASFDWFRTFPQDIKNDAADQQTKLTMPVLARRAPGRDDPDPAQLLALGIVAAAPVRGVVLQALVTGGSGGPAVARAISATVRLLKRSAAEPC